ncbi:hypothetical protein D3C78_1736010 [compost metagenome]
MLPSSETRPITSRKLRTALVTRMPCCWTSCGSSGVASCSLFCTCTWAMSGSTPWLKVAVMVMLPSELLSEEM